MSALVESAPYSVYQPCSLGQKQNAVDDTSNFNFRVYYDPTGAKTLKHQQP